MTTVLCHDRVVLILLGLALAGCGGPDVKRVPLVRVRGVVTLDGTPLEKAVVVFESADGSFSYAETDSRGRYDLWFDSQTRGVTPGAKTVRISTNRRLLGLNSNDERGAGRPGGGRVRQTGPREEPGAVQQPIDSGRRGHSRER